MTNYQAAVIAAAILTGDTLRGVLEAMRATPEGYKPPPPELPPRVARKPGEPLRRG
jgi:hypothetical protein